VDERLDPFQRVFALGAEHLQLGFPIDRAAKIAGSRRSDGVLGIAEGEGGAAGEGLGPFACLVHKPFRRDDTVAEAPFEAALGREFLARRDDFVGPLAAKA
jgi:hypothetical protein